jgi:hypothetical protein
MAAVILSTIGLAGVLFLFVRRALSSVSYN